MARNRHPEVTEERILEAAERLFLQKGYDNTTIQDIVDELGGLTKGAVYHHFRSKEEIMDAVGDRMFRKNNPFEAVFAREDLNGLEKMRQVIVLNQSDRARLDMNYQAMPLLKNPRILANVVESNLRELTPLFRRLIDEGIADGSISTEYPRELAELIPLLTSLWLAPTVYPATRGELLNKFRFIGEMLDRMGLPVVDEGIMALAAEYFGELDGLAQ